jgi:hypothetical protein
MDARKTARGRYDLKRALALAYRPAEGHRTRRIEEPLPGPLFDAAVFALFVFFGVASLLV